MWGGQDIPRAAQGPGAFPDLPRRGRSNGKSMGLERPVRAERGEGGTTLLPYSVRPLWAFLAGKIPLRWAGVAPAGLSATGLFFFATEGPFGLPPSLN